MQTQMFPWMRKDLNKPKGKQEFLTMFQGAYRDAGPFKEYIFPEECLEDVLAMLMFDWASYISQPKRWAMRRLLGNGVRAIPKEIPKYPNFAKCGLVTYDKKGKPLFRPYRYVEQRGVVLHFIGIKKDERGIMEVKATGEKYDQELL